MRGKTNMDGVQEQGTFELLPEGEYLFEISEKTDGESKKGDPMVTIKLTVVDGEHKGKYVWDQILIPSPDSPSAKILGRTKHFLHCIGQPYEGDIEWDSDRWGWLNVRAVVKHEQPNEYHKYVKAVVSGYILDEEQPVNTTDGPDL